PDRTSSPAVRNTGLLMNIVCRTPANRKVLGTIPSNRMHVAVDTFRAGSPYVKGSLVNYPVPGTVMTFFSCKRNPPPVIGNPPGGVQIGATTTTPNPAVIISAENRLFFASAGADEDFRACDDNMYSFEQ